VFVRSSLSKWISVVDYASPFLIRKGLNQVIEPLNSTAGPPSALSVGTKDETETMSKLFIRISRDRVCYCHTVAEAWSLSRSVSLMFFREGVATGERICVLSSRTVLWMNRAQ
jgi:hypothetical protein